MLNCSSYHGTVQLSCTGSKGFGALLLLKDLIKWSSPYILCGLQALSTSKEDEQQTQFTALAPSQENKKGINILNKRDKTCFHTQSLSNDCGTQGIL